ncbi:hypothetical protein OHA25_60510 (plasmid) [Nonomuraea sp. NBC_00507]|uniref:hypothetical protein n=1 Tax=Nonomuraea sp. NBC_00507 TaxID=2976002 RepID=UPI002E19D4AF
MNPTTVAHLRLSALRRRHPAYEFVRGRDESGQECWQARLCVEITPPMRAAGVVEVIQRPNHDLLVYELYRQEVALRPFHATHLNPLPRAYAI